jgi:hypothetical protein
MIEINHLENKMSWILAVYLTSSTGSLAREFETEKECVGALRVISLMEQNNPDIRKITCTPGIVISDSDEE